MEARRVLVIEDDPAVRLALEVFLSAEPSVAEVSTAPDGDQGIAQARSRVPDVIVTDSAMPGASGEELGRTLRASCPGATIISFSGLAREAPWADHRIQKGGADTFDALAAAVSNAPVEQQAPTAAPAPPEAAELQRRRVIHDLRNLLTPLAGYAGLLESSAQDLDADQVRDIAERIQRAVERLNRTLEEF